jgi:hypothetical protein
MSRFSYVTTQNAPAVSAWAGTPRTSDGWGLFPNGKAGWLTSESLRRFTQTIRWQAAQPPEVFQCIGSRSTVTDMFTGVTHDTLYAPEDISPSRDFSTTSDALLLVLTEPGDPQATVPTLANVCRTHGWTRSVDVMCAATSSDVDEMDRIETCVTNLVRQYVADVRCAPVILVAVGEACLAAVRIRAACAAFLDKARTVFVCLHGSFWAGHGPVAPEVWELRSLPAPECHGYFFVVAENSAVAGVYPGLPFMPGGCYHAVVRSIPMRSFISIEELDLLRCALPF